MVAEDYSNRVFSLLGEIYRVYLVYLRPLMRDKLGIFGLPVKLYFFPEAITIKLLIGTFNSFYTSSTTDFMISQCFSFTQWPWMIKCQINFIIQLKVS